MAGVKTIHGFKFLDWTRTTPKKIASTQKVARGKKKKR